MKITRQRLKQIILEEIDLMETNSLDVIDSGDEDDSNVASMGDISEGEGMELVHQVAQTLFDTGVTAAESPEELALALKGIGKMALLALGGGALGVAGVAGMDAMDKLAKDTDGSDDPSQALEEEGGDVLTNLITQAIQEQIEEMREENN
jgi:hypothetical protein